jgi:prephenate dehydratase
MPGKPWEYMFYVDIEADLETESLVSVMDKLKSKTETLKIIGRY